MKINDITDYDKFEKLFLNFINNKKGFHELLVFIQNNHELNQLNNQYKKSIPENVYRGVYFWKDDLYDEGIDIFKLPREIEQQEKEKTFLKDKIPYSSCSYSYDVAQKFSKVLGDVGFVIEFVVNEKDILFIPLAYLDIISDDIKETIRYEKEVIINPKTSDIKNVKRVKR